MNVSALQSELDLKPLNIGDGSREITGGYCGDLLSWVMGRASAGNAWMTIMTNVNIVAVALLADVSCVIICEGCEITDELIAAAKDKRINLLLSKDSVYETAGKLYTLLRQQHE